MAMTPVARQRLRRRSALGVLLVALGALLAFTGPGPFGAPAGALAPSNAGVSMTSITAYSTYPTFTFADGCSAATTLVGVQYAVDPDGAGPAPAGNPNGWFQNLGTLPPGSTVIMTWSGWAPGCAADISLSVKRADVPSFDPATNQELIAYVGCNANGAGCTVPGGYRLELTMPGQAQGVCYYQVDAVVGAPLDVVGPNGSFYGQTWRQNNAATMNEDGPNMLIHANNGGTACTTTTTTTPTTAPSTTTTVLGGTTTTTGPGGTTTTTAAGVTTTTATVLGTTLTQPSTSTTGATVLGVSSTRPSTGPGSLARTGGPSAWGRTIVALGLVSAGVGVAVVARERTRRLTSH